MSKKILAYIDIILIDVYLIVAFLQLRKNAPIS